MRALSVVLGLVGLVGLLGCAAPAPPVTPSPPPAPAPQPVQLTPPVSPTAPANDVVIHGALGVRLHDAMLRLEALGLSGTVLVGVGEELVLSHGYGLCDRQARTPCTTESRFDLGSVAKQFTATVIMQLVAEGQLAVEDAVGRYVADMPPHLARITVHQLLTHTSGLRDELTRYQAGDAAGFLTRVNQHPVDTPPGLSAHYSNANYSLLALIIENVTGESFTEVMTARVLRPAGLTDTSVADYDDPPPAGAAQGYRGAPGDLRPVGRLPWYARGAGGMWGTTRDLWRWHAALRAGDILTPTAQGTMLQADLGGFGYGWRIEEGPRGKLVHHGGTTFGFQTELRRYLDADVVIAFAINQRVGWRTVLESTLEGLVFGEAVDLPSASATARPGLTGRYRVGDDVLVVDTRDGVFTVRAEGDMGVTLVTRPRRWQERPPAAEAARSLSATRQALDALRSGERQPLAKLLHPRLAPNAAADLEDVWADMTRLAGVPRSHTARLLGLVPEPDSPRLRALIVIEGPLASTYLALVLEQGLLREAIPQRPIDDRLQAVPTAGGLAWVSLLDGDSMQATQRDDGSLDLWLDDPTRPIAHAVPER